MRTLARMVALEERGYLIWVLMSAEEFSKKAQVRARGEYLDTQLLEVPLI